MGRRGSEVRGPNRTEILVKRPWILKFRISMFQVTVGFGEPRRARPSRGEGEAKFVSPSLDLPSSVDLMTSSLRRPASLDPASNSSSRFHSTSVSSSALLRSSRWNEPFPPPFPFHIQDPKEPTPFPFILSSSITTPEEHHRI